MSTVDESTRLDPQGLDPEAMDPTTYHAVVGPPLQVAAEVAAARGDPTLHADMPAMLALVHLVSRLARHWRDDRDTDAHTERMLTSAPAAACVMVLQEAEMAEDAIGQCLAALEAAYAQLAEHQVAEIASPLIERAWHALTADRREAALADLKQAALRIVGAIDAWQARMH